MIRAIRTIVDRAEAADILSAAAPLSADVERRVFYPFLWFRLRCVTRSLLGERASTVGCLVDARTRLCATSDPFALETIETSCRDVMEPKLEEADGRRLAERYVTYTLRRRQSAMTRFELDALETALVHKPFWIVLCSAENQRAFRMLVDGVTGSFFPIPAGGDGRA